VTVYLLPLSFFRTCLLGVILRCRAGCFYVTYPARLTAEHSDFPSFGLSAMTNLPPPPLACISATLPGKALLLLFQRVKYLTPSEKCFSLTYIKLSRLGTMCTAFVRNGKASGLSFLCDSCFSECYDDILN
jgi:hypothetical protein